MIIQFESRLLCAYYHILKVYKAISNRFRFLAINFRHLINDSNRLFYISMWGPYNAQYLSQFPSDNYLNDQDLNSQSLSSLLDLIR